MGGVCGEVAGFDGGGESVVGPDALGVYKRDGVICFRNVFGHAWLKTIEGGIDQAFGGSVLDDAVVKRAGDCGSFFTGVGV